MGVSLGSGRVRCQSALALGVWLGLAEFCVSPAAVAAPAALVTLHQAAPPRPKPRVRPRPREEAAAPQAPETPASPPPSTSPPASEPAAVAPAPSAGSSVPPPPGSAQAAPSVPDALPQVAFRPVALPVYGGFPPPPGYVLESKPNTGLIIGGAVAFGTSYALGLIFGAANDFEQGLGYTAIPLAGPWIALAARNFDCAPANNPSDPFEAQAAADACQDATIENGLAAAVLAGAGVMQLVGATLVVVGVIDRKEAWVRGDLVESEGASLRFDATPTLAGGLFRLSGRF